MKRISRDSVLSILGFALAAGAFVFAVYLPQHKACAKVRDEIAASERSIRDIPLRVAELELLKADVARRQTFLTAARAGVPLDPDVHGVIHRVAELARQSDLQVSRLEPLSGTSRESYQSLPFKLTFSGPFRGVLLFLKGLESRERLFHVQRFMLRQRNGKFGATIEGDIDFVIYVDHAKSNDFSEINGSSDPTAADTREEGVEDARDAKRQARGNSNGQ